LLYVVFQGFMFYAVTADTAPGASAALKLRYRSPYHTAVMPLLAVGLVPDFWMSALTSYGSIPCR